MHEELYDEITNDASRMSYIKAINQRHNIPCAKLLHPGRSCIQYAKSRFYRSLMASLSI